MGNGIVVLPGPTLVEGVISLIASTDAFLGRTPSFHNTCDVEHGYCWNHKVPVYRDGVDWATEPEWNRTTRRSS